ncbi:MAG TPA: NlpC/P60 family protein [Mycobacteriales bacterium]|nr:NlpC/P60 family protein [Mycobacteriales bacterium]
MTSPRLRLAALAAAVAATATAAVGVGPGRAVADPVGDARARAAALAQTVDRLQVAAEVATERYDAVEAQLGQAVIRQELAERQVESDQESATAAADQVTARVRALYESGGRASLLATVLTGTDPADALARLHVVSNILSFDDAGVAAAVRTTDRARQLAAQLTAAASEVTRLQHAAAVATGRVRSLLLAQQRALSAATAEVRRLLAARQAALAAASAADFTAALRAAGGTLDGSTVPPNATAAGAIAAARSRLGDPYVWGATGPHSFDCSGLTQWSYAHVGVQLPRVAADQWNAGPHVALADLEPGDLLFWATDVTNPATIHHVAIYLGNGMMIAAPHTGDVVKVQPVYMSGYIGATRPYVH